MNALVIFRTPPNPLDFIAGAAVFGLIVAVFVMFMLLVVARRSRRTQRVEKRLGLSDPESGQGRVLRLWREGRDAAVTVPSKPRKGSLLKWMNQLGREAGWSVPAETVLLGLAGAAGLAAVGALVITESILLAGVAAATVIMCFSWYTRRRITRRSAIFERQLVDALQLAGRSLRAGHPLLGAFQLIAEELEDPIRTIFAEVCQQQQMGVSLDAALRTTSAQYGSSDLKLFATSVTIQYRSGGNLADMMDRVAFVIHERIRLGRRVRVLTAQTQFSKRVLIGMPFLLFVVLYALNPQYMDVLVKTDTGNVILALGGAGMLLGVWMMNRLARIQW